MNKQEQLIFDKQVNTITNVLKQNLSENNALELAIQKIT